MVASSTVRSSGLALGVGEIEADTCGVGNNVEFAWHLKILPFLRGLLRRSYSKGVAVSILRFNQLSTYLFNIENDPLPDHFNAAKKEPGDACQRTAAVLASEKDKRLLWATCVG
jgi:hypothetical protein